MRVSDLSVMKCPISGQDLKISEVKNEIADHVYSGIITTIDGKYSFAIENGVPNFIEPLGSKKTFLDEEERTHNLFGYEWQYFSDWGWLEQYPNVKNANLKYFGGLVEDTKRAFRGKTLLLDTDIDKNHMVLDGGCGNGRFCSEIRRRGAKVVGIDAGIGIYKAFEKLKNDNNVILIRGNLLSPPLKFLNLISYSPLVLFNIQQTVIRLWKNFQISLSQAGNFLLIVMGRACQLMN